MEEKERYSWYNHSTEEIYDNKDNVVFVGAIMVLNQQNRRIWELIEENKQLKQSQKQLAIEELENLKKEFNSRKLEYKTMENSFHIYGLRIDRIFEIIDDQIKELKGEKSTIKCSLCGREMVKLADGVNYCCNHCHIQTLLNMPDIGEE